MSWGYVANLTAGATNTISPPSASASEPLRWAIFVSSFCTSAAAQDGPGRFSIGFVTNDGGSIQHQCYAGVDEDAQADSWCAIENSNTRALIALDPTSATATSRVEEYTVTTFTDTGMTLTRSTGSATPRIMVICGGGADISRARAFGTSITNAVASQDLTVVAGFGQPDVCFGMTCGSASSTISLTQSANAAGSFGVATLSGKFGMGWFSQDAAATSNIIGFNTASGWIFTDPSLASGRTGNLAAQVNWPTDGIEISFPSNSVATYFHGLAIKTTATVAIGTHTSTTSAGGTVDFNAGVTPALAIVFGGAFLDTGLAQVISDPTGMQLGSWGIGAFDGTNQGYVGWSMDDANATMNTGGSTSATNGYQLLFPGSSGAPVIDGEAALSFSGNNVRETWSNAASVATAVNGAVAFQATAAPALPRLQLAPFQGAF